MKIKIDLFADKEKCCGCGACASICPRQAIQMCEDADGFLYPKILETLCIRCGLCKEACRFQGEAEAAAPTDVYAAQSGSGKVLEAAASGGVFSAMAECVLASGGAVCGCSWDSSEGGLQAKHVLITDAEQLPALQGSKYVQSRADRCYSQIKSLLQTEKTVLFSGTPCQVDGLRGYLQKDYPNLITMDLVCHGTPNARLFGDYISQLEKSFRGTVTDFRFRDKSQGWGLRGSAEIRNKQGARRRIYFPAWKSSYYKLFLGGEIYRESCYHCKYACSNRVGDITVGDYWGIERAHPEYLKENGGKMDPRRGVSCVLINTEKGKQAILRLANQLIQEPSSLEKAAKENGQLNHPSAKGINRSRIFQIYEKKGYAGVERWYQRNRLINKLKRIRIK